MLTIQASKPSNWSKVQSYVGTRFAQLVHPPNLASNADGGFMDMARISDFIWNWNIGITTTYLQWKLTAWRKSALNKSWELLEFGIPFRFLEQPLLLPAWPVSIEVRTWDATPPVLVVVDVESRSEEICMGHLNWAEICRLTEVKNQTFYLTTAKVWYKMACLASQWDRTQSPWPCSLMSLELLTASISEPAKSANVRHSSVVSTRCFHLC